MPTTLTAATSTLSTALTVAPSTQSWRRFSNLLNLTHKDSRSLSPSGGGLLFHSLCFRHLCCEDTNQPHHVPPRRYVMGLVFADSFAFTRRYLLRLMWV